MMFSMNLKSYTFDIFLLPVFKSIITMIIINQQFIQMIQSVQLRSIAANLHKNNILKRSTDKQSLKQSKQKRREVQSVIRDEDYDNTSDCNTVCSINLANYPLIGRHRQRLQSSDHLSIQKSMINRQLSLIKEKSRYRDTSLAKSNEIKKLTKEISDLKKQNKRLTKNNKNCLKQLNGFKKMFSQLQQQLVQQKSSIFQNCIPRLSMEKQQDPVQQDNEITLNLYQQKIEYLEQQLEKLTQYTSNILSIRQQNIRLTKQKQQMQEFYSEMIQKNQQELTFARKQINRLNIQLDGINRKHYYYIEKQREKVMEERHKYLLIKEEMNQLYQQLKKLEITEKTKRQMQIRPDKYGQAGYYNLKPQNSMEIQ